MQQFTVNAHGATHELIRFHAPLPQPGPACTEPLPQDKREHDLQFTQQCQQQQEAKINEHKAHCDGSFLDKLTVAVTDTLNSIDKTLTAAVQSTESAVRSFTDDHAFGRLRTHFPELLNERLLGDYRCKLHTRNGVLAGFLQVTNHHIMFIPDDGTPFSLTVCNILCIQTLKLEKIPSEPPVFHSFTPVPVQEAEALQLFLTSGNLLIFKEFLSLRGAVAEAFNVIDHAWRADTPVPNPNFQFCEPSKFIQPDITVYPIKPTTHQAAPETFNTTHPYRAPTVDEKRSVNALETHS